MPSTATTMSEERLARRVRLVEEHVRQENRHDLAGIMQTFGATARYEDEPWGERHEGRDGVRGYYEALMGAVADLHIEVRRRHVADEAIVLEVVISGTHTGTWRGLPATGRRVRFPLCAVYTFDEDDKLAGERIHYDRATVLVQLGVLHEPSGWLDRMLMPVLHPLTLARAAARALVGTGG